VKGKKRQRLPPVPDLIVEGRLKQRRRVRLTLLVVSTALALSVLLTHWGQGGDGDDWARFDRRRATVVSVSLNGTVSVQVPNETGETPVRLIGIDLPRAGTAQAAASSRDLAALALGREFTLRLEPIQTRSPGGALLAYLFLSDTDNLNLDLARDGIGYADRRSPHSLQVQFEQAESDARKKGRGFWKAPTDDQMPDWRQQWLNDAREKKHRKKAG
jgi:endonuclease YncB( thermonuclease family)